MLNIRDIISLANAGYTAEQIDEMQKQDDGQQQQQDAGQNQQQQQQDAGQQSNKGGNAPSSISEKILKELEDMRAALQSSNIGNSRQPSNDSLDDVLASIISPKPNFDK